MSTDAKAYYTKLREIVEQGTKELGTTPDGTLITDFVVVGRGTRFTEDGKSYTHVFQIYSEGTVDWITLMGLAAHFKESVALDMFTPDEDDDDE